MTDLTPNDLSHLSEESFIALCPQGEHAPGPPSLSPAAQAVWDAFNEDEAGVFVDYGDKLAAALRAAADQLTFEDAFAGAVINPHELLDIAAELEGYELQ